MKVFPDSSYGGYFRKLPSLRRRLHRHYGVTTAGWHTQLNALSWVASAALRSQVGNNLHHDGNVGPITLIAPLLLDRQQ